MPWSETKKGLLFQIAIRDPCKACDLRCNATLFLLSDSSVNSHSDSLFALPLQEKLEFLKSV